jgi:hypothetical protein
MPYLQVRISRLQPKVVASIDGSEVIVHNQLRLVVELQTRRQTLAKNNLDDANITVALMIQLFFFGVCRRTVRKG